MNRHRVALSIILVGGGEQRVAMVKPSVEAGSEGEFRAGVRNQLSRGSGPPHGRVN
jgi:hypothetical protein